MGFNLAFKGLNVLIGTGVLDVRDISQGSRYEYAHIFIISIDTAKTSPTPTFLGTVDFMWLTTGTAHIPRNLYFHTGRWAGSKSWMIPNTISLRTWSEVVLSSFYLWSSRKSVPFHWSHHYHSIHLRFTCEREQVLLTVCSSPTIRRMECMMCHLHKGYLSQLLLLSAVLNWNSFGPSS